MQLARVRPRKKYMTTHKLTITIDLDYNNDEDSIIVAKQFLFDCLYSNPRNPHEDNVKVTLLRENDRSNKNILLPKIEGRLGDHYPSRKATLAEVLESKKND